MEARFQNLPFKVSSLDGRNFVLLSDVFYTTADGTRYCLPAGATSDGASTPPEVWPLIPPFGLYWPAAFLHDTAYRNTLLVWGGTGLRDYRTTDDGTTTPKPENEPQRHRGTEEGLEEETPGRRTTGLRDYVTAGGGYAWGKASLTKEQCDLLLREAMGALGVGEIEREAIFEGVVLGGQSSFEADRGNIQAEARPANPTFNAQQPIDGKDGMDGEETSRVGRPALL